jgi:hypothetical protein
MKIMSIKLIGRSIVLLCFLCIMALSWQSLMPPAWAASCPKGAYCTSNCDDLPGVIEARTPFYYEGEFDPQCIGNLGEQGIRFREEGNRSMMVIILTTYTPFPFTSEWVGRREGNPSSWHFQQYHA